MTFGVLRSQIFFHSPKSALIIQAHVAEGDRLLEQYQKGNPEKKK
jgi:hypothetical protein